ncbi:MAG TPA: TolC family protein [Limnobacter sp.]|nr:TolC family protein [Limnobacter sp.]
MINSNCVTGVIMSRCVVQLLFAMGVICSQGVLASQPHPALNSLIRDTLSNHPLLAAQRASVEAANFGISSARREFLPRPSFSVEQTVYDNDLPGNNPDPLSAVVRVDLPVYTGGRLTGRLDQAKSLENLAKAQWSESRLELSIRVVNAWAGWVGAQLKVQAYLDSMDQHRRLLELVTRRAEQGYSASTDVEFARLRLQSIESELQGAKSQLRSNLAQLKIVSGKAIHESVSVPTELGKIGDALVWLERVQRSGVLVDHAMQNNPSIARVQALLEGAKAEMEIAKSRDWPELTLSAEKRFGGIELVDRIQDDRSRAFLGINTQFGAGFSHRTEQKRLIAEVENTKQLGLAEQRTLIEQIEVDLEALRGAEQKLESLSQALQSSELVLASWERQFLEGRKQWQDLMNAAREKVQLQTQLADVHATIQAAGWRLYLTCEGTDALLAMAEVKADE